MTKLRHAIVGQIRRAQHEQGLTCERLAEMAEIDGTTLYRLLHGRTFGWSTVERVADALGIEHDMADALYAREHPEGHNHAERKIAARAPWAIRR